MILHDIKLLISQSLMNAYGDQIIKLGTVCLFIKFETAKCFTTFLCRDHISVMLEFHTQMTAHNRVHYCTFLIVSLITPLDIDRWHGLMIFFLLLRKIDSKFCFCGLWRCLLSLFVLLLTTIAACLVDTLLRHCCSVISFLTFFSFFLSSDTVFFSFHRWSIFLLVWYKTKNLKLTQNILLQRVEEHTSRLRQVADER